MNDLVPARPPLTDRLLTTPWSYRIVVCTLGLVAFLTIPGWIRWFLLTASLFVAYTLPPFAIEGRLESLYRGGQWARILTLFELLDRRLPAVAAQFAVYRIDALIGLGEREKAKALLVPFREWAEQRVTMRGYYRTRVATLYYQLGDAEGVHAWCAAALEGRLHARDRMALERLRAWASALSGDFARARALLAAGPALALDSLFIEAMAALEAENDPERALRILDEAAKVPGTAPERDDFFLALLRTIAQLRLGRAPALALEQVLRALDEAAHAGPLTTARLHLAAALHYRALGDATSAASHLAASALPAPPTALPSPAAPAAPPRSSPPPPAPREPDRA